MFVGVRSLCLLTALVASTGASPSPQLAERETPRPRFGSVPYGASITRCTVPGKIALTFDDGPCEFTGQILDTLEANGAKGTFFVVGSSGEAGIASGRFTSVVKRLVANGHQIGSHSWSHADFETIGYAEKLAEITKLEEAFVSTIGMIPTYFRPPYTSCGSECYAALGEMGYHVTDYDLDTKDYENGGSAAKGIYSSALSGGSSGTTSFIVLAHDIQPFTVNGFVQWMIDTAKGQGYQFTTLGECLGDPAANWYRDPKTGGPIGGGAPVPPKPSTTSTPPTSTTAPPTTSSAAPSTTSAPPSVKPTTTTGKPEVTPPLGNGQESATRSPSPTTSKPATVTSPNAAGAVAGSASKSILAALLGALACTLMF